MVDWNDLGKIAICGGLTLGISYNVLESRHSKVILIG